jgi:hypothetical protein
MSNFSNNTSVSATKAVFKTHHVYEVASGLAEAKSIADGFSNVHRWQHRAHVTIVASPNIRPYDPIYLDGLPNGLSGYWTVLSVKHQFGGRPARYLVELEVGTDIIGDTSLTASNKSDTRDVQSDLAGQSLVASEAKLTSYSLSVNGSSLSPNNGIVTPTGLSTAPGITGLVIDGVTPYKTSAPNLSGVKRTVQWTSTKTGKVIK